MLQNNQPIVIKVPPVEEYRALFDEIKEMRKEISELKGLKAKRKRRTKEEIESAEKEYSPYKSDGKLKPRAGESIKSYDEFLAMQNFFLKNGSIRNWAIWTVGVSIGLRASDLTKLKVSWFLNKDLTFKEYLDIREKKTIKRNKILITESIIHALTKYFDSIKWNFTLNDYVFKSQKTANNGRLEAKTVWEIISSAARKVGLKQVINAHSMRHSFGCIAYCVGTATFDPYRMESVRGLMKHSSILITAGYLGVLNDAKDSDRIAVSDFVLGKSGINKLSLIKSKEEK